jgi:hypothetical protein
MLKVLLTYFSNLRQSSLNQKFHNCSILAHTLPHRLTNYKDTKAKCRHLKIDR